MSTDKKSPETHDQGSQHESLHRRLDSIDKKLKESRDNLNVDLDAMLDEAESSLGANHEFQDDEDAIDRLLMNAGFDADDALLETEADTNVRVVEDADRHDELDDFLGIDSFGEDFNEPQKTPIVEAGEMEQAGEISSEPFNEHDEDAIDRLLMTTASDDELVQSKAVEDTDTIEALNDFSDFSDFNDQEAVTEAEASAPVGPDLLLSREELQAEIEELELENEDSVAEQLDDFSDFSDFLEPEIIPTVEAEEAEQTVDDSSLHADDLSEFDLLGDDFDELDMIQDADIETSALAVEDLSVPDDEQQTPVEQPSEDEGAAVDSVVGLEAEDMLEPADGSEDEFVDDAGLSDEVDDVDVPDLIQDDEVMAPVDLVSSDEELQAAAEQSFGDEEVVDGLLLDEDSDAEDRLEADGDELVDDVDALEQIRQGDEDLVSPDQEQHTTAEQPSDDEDAVDGLLLADDSDAEEILEQADGKVDELVDDTGLSDEIDEFSGFGDDFDASDLIQKDEINASADLLVSDEEQQPSDDEDAVVDNLFLDVGFDDEDALEQTDEKPDEFGDDEDLSKIDNFFQLDEVSDDFSKQIEEAQLAEMEKSSTQEDDFLLPDFDITADTEESDMGSDAIIKGDELTDVFGGNDFLDEDEAVQVFDSETEELNLRGNEAITEPKPNPTANAAVEDVGSVKLSPFGFEHEDMKKQLQEAENKVKKIKIFSYAALGFGVVALSAAVGLGVMNFGAKAEISKLAETVATLETSLAKNAANNPSEEINAMKNSVVQLNQQVDGFITELKGNPQSPVDLLNNKVPDIVAKQDMVSKALEMLQVKMGGGLEEKKISSAPEPPKAEAEHEHKPAAAPTPTKEGHDHEIAPVKAESAHEHVLPKEKSAHETPPAKEAAVHEHAPTKERAMHEAAPAKTEAVPAVAAKVKTQPEAAKPKPLIPEKAVAKEEPVKVNKQAQAAPGKWGVNLVAVKQEWYAKSKAAEFARQGIFVEVIPVQGNMYRLRVGGFRSKAEANSNTARIKKALNLDKVWVSDN